MIGFRGGRGRHLRRIDPSNYPLVPDVVEGAIAGGLEQVRTERRLEDYILATPPKLQHHILCDIFRGGAIAEDRLRESDQAGIVGPEDGVELVEVVQVGHEANLPAFPGPGNEIGLPIGVLGVTGVTFA